MTSIDLGCGQTKRKGYLGIDIRRNVAADIVADLEHLPIKNDSVNQVYSRRAIQHVKNQEEAFKEIYRILVPRGKIIVIVASLWGFLFYKVGLSQSRGGYAVFHLFTKNKLRKQLEQQNFMNIKINRIKSRRKIGYDFQVKANKQ